MVGMSYLVVLPQSTVVRRMRWSIMVWRLELGRRGLGVWVGLVGRGWLWMWRWS